MGGKVDYVRKKFKPLLDKCLANALAHAIGKEFPRVGGPRMRHLCAEMILEVLGRHLRPLEHVRHGQILWMGISVDDPPCRGKTTAETDLVPVVLDLSTAHDVECVISRQPRPQRLQEKAVRLCQQAYDQGALLNLSDLSEILNTVDSRLSTLLSDYEKTHGKVVPRRSNIHDVGTGLTHKRIICRKRFLEGKTPGLIARETYHSLEAVDRYLGQYDRVRHCRQQGLDAAKTAYTLNCTIGLVREYLAIDDEVGGKDD